MAIEDEEIVAVKAWSKDRSRNADISVRRIKPGGVLVEPTISLMVKNFIPRETMNGFLGFTSEPESIKALEKAWREKISEGNSLAAVLNQPDASEPIVVAANITYVVEGHEGDFGQEDGGTAIKTIGQVLNKISEACDVSKKYRVDKYLSAMGLGVDSEYHGLGLGEILLKARKELCKRLGLTCSATVFTGVISQHLATKAGFETIYEIKYNEIIVNGKNVFSAAPPDFYIKLMARTYEF